MDFREMSTGDLQALIVDAQQEINRRNRAASAGRELSRLLGEVLAGSGAVEGEPWVQPTGYEDVYPEGWTVTHEGKTWVSLIAGNFLEPGVSGWREVAGEGEAPPDYVPPAGYEGAYSEGDLVTFEGNVWKCLQDGTVWSPSEAPARWERQA